MTGPADPWATESGGSDPLEEGRQLLDALGDIHRAEAWGKSFEAMYRLTDRERMCVVIAATSERASRLDAEDSRRRTDARWLRRGRVSRTARFTWAALLHEWRRGR